MSPTPIREALRLLQADGLIEHTPHRGMVVKEYSPENIAEIYRLRSVLEPLATEWAADSASDEELAEIRKLHTQLVGAAAKRPSAPNVAALNSAWHLAIYGKSGSRYLLEFIERLWGAIGGGKAVWVSHRVDESLAEHQEIMESLERRDGRTAARLMRDHIERGSMMHDERLRSLREDADDRPAGSAGSLPS
jgi:DNA-binding GntR family transcriptional regulator